MVSYGGQKRANVNSGPKQMVSHLASGQIDSENKKKCWKNREYDTGYSSILGEKADVDPNVTWTYYQSNAHKTQKPRTNTLHGLRLLLINLATGM